MKTRWIVFSFIIAVSLFVVPFQQAIVFTETKKASPHVYMLPVNGDDDFALRYTHSIHLSDVTEHYTVSEGRFRMRYMTYMDTAIGMPATAEEGQTLTVENGVYTLQFARSYLDDFTLYVGDLDLQLTLLYDGRSFNLKETLTRGHSYRVSIQKLSFYDRIKGVTLQ